MSVHRFCESVARCQVRKAVRRKLFGLEAARTLEEPYVALPAFDRRRTFVTRLYYHHRLLWDL